MGFFRLFYFDCDTLCSCSKLFCSLSEFIELVLLKVKINKTTPIATKINACAPSKLPVDIPKIGRIIKQIAIKYYLFRYCKYSIKNLHKITKII